MSPFGRRWRSVCCLCWRGWPNCTPLLPQLLVCRLMRCTPAQSAECTLLPMLLPACCTADPPIAQSVHAQSRPLASAMLYVQRRQQRCWRRLLLSEPFVPRRVA